MSWSDEELRSLYQKWTARDARRSDCPEAESLARVAAGEAFDRERAQVAAHVADCSDCAAELRLARGGLAAPDGTVGASADPAVGRRRPPFLGARWMAAAAALAVAALSLPLFVWQRADRVHDTTRGAAEVEVRPAPDSTLASPPRELAWPDQPGAERYRVRLFDVRAEPIWESGPSEVPRLELPDEAVRAMAAAGDGAAFVWTVEVEGAAASRLGPFWFRVAAAP